MSSYPPNPNNMWTQYSQQPTYQQAPPPPPPQQVTYPMVDPRVADLEAKYAQMVSLLQTKAQFPTQQRAGVIRYPNRIPFPMTLSAELKPQSSPATGFFGTTNEVCRASVNIDVENPTFIESFGFNLYRPDTANNLANAPASAIGVYLPLSGFRNPFIETAPGTPFYLGKDFRWRVVNSSNNRLWQDGWKSSDQANNDERKGYRLPVEYEANRNDVFVFEAQPIGIPYALGLEQDFVLEVVLHIYKMVMP